MFRRRETMIALRARQKAVEVARDVAYPPLEVPPPPAPSMPIASQIDYEPAPPPEEPEYLRYEPQSTIARVLMSDVVLAVLMGLGTLVVMLLCKYG